MMSRMIRYTLISVLSFAMAGSAFAQETPEEGGGEGEGTAEGTPAEGGTGEATPTEGTTTDVAAGDMGDATPVEWILRPIVNQKGRLDAGLDIGIPTGPNNDG